eukprot:4857878-Amphidinium_carterae.1
MPTQRSPGSAIHDNRLATATAPNKIEQRSGTKQLVSRRTALLTTHHAFVGLNLARLLRCH